MPMIFTAKVQSHSLFKSVCSFTLLRAPGPGHSEVVDGQVIFTSFIEFAATPLWTMPPKAGRPVG